MFKVGDEVLVKAKVVKVNSNNSSNYPYKVDFGDDFSWRSAADILPVPTAPTFRVGDKVKPTIGVRSRTVEVVVGQQPCYKINGSLYMYAEADLTLVEKAAPAKPATSYSLFVDDTNDIDWRRICEEADAGTDVIKVTAPGVSTVLLLRESWLRRANPDWTLGDGSVQATLDGYRTAINVVAPDGWRVRVPGERWESRMLTHIAAIRAAIAAKEAAAKKIEVKVEVV
jgi:hypothetical protein